MPRVTSLNGGIIGADNTPSPSKKITTFTSNGCFNRTETTAQVVVVAGGGGGSYGAGGAGGVYVTGTDHPLPSDAVPVTVGAGGSQSDTNGGLGGHGNDSVFATACDPITALKGMGGGGQNPNPVGPLESGYGSGGGAGFCNPAEGGHGTHPGSFGGCSSVYQGSPGGRAGRLRQLYRFPVDNNLFKHQSASMLSGRSAKCVDCCFQQRFAQLGKLVVEAAALMATTRKAFAVLFFRARARVDDGANASEILAFKNYVLKLQAVALTSYLYCAHMCVHDGVGGVVVFVRVLPCTAACAKIF